MGGTLRWIALGLLGLALAFGARWLVRVADPNASDYAQPPGAR
jgi:hypothetical protein